ncbi:MAG: hypothetical protein JXA97_13210 [Anaerolineales bacterium]|nr:hypothetical protein [Anaerolineales bacterium]
MTFLYALWLLFAGFFFYMAYICWQQAKDDIRPFNLRERYQNEVAPKTGGLENANEVFVAEFNAYLQKMNAHNRKRMEAAAIGFFIAGVISVISLLPLFLG